MVLRIINKSTLVVFLYLLTVTPFTFAAVDPTIVLYLPFEGMKQDFETRY